MRVFATAAEAHRAAAELLAEAGRGANDIALSGGSAPGPAFELAAALQPDWSRARLWWGDERCVPPDDERSNFRLARETLIGKLDAPPAVVYRIRGELGGQAAAAEYDQLLDGVELELAFQGVGPDGHTASLFPGSPALQERELRSVAVPHQDVERVTMTLPVLCGARRVLFLALGEQKAHAVAQAFGGPPNPQVPASLVRSQHGETVVVLDRAAAGRLDL